ncbi:MAG: hypothetical protein OXI15_18910, partial [Chromatiales bacterium]|nr:hypothetical protein [Chromatiales bacterium]
MWGKERIAAALAPGDMDEDRRAMTPPGLLGAWLRRHRSPVFRPDLVPPRRQSFRAAPGPQPFRPPRFPGRASAGIAAAFDGIRRLGRAAVSALLLLTLLAGITTQAYAYHTPVAYFGSVSQSVDEGASLARVPVSLSRTMPEPIRVWYSVGGTATSGSDFLISGHRGQNKVEIPAGARTATIPVTLIDDSAPEGSETVILTIEENWRYAPGFQVTHTVTIVDNEPVVSFASASQSAGEGSGTNNVEVTLSPAPTTAVTFTYTVGGTATAGSDYTALSGTLSVPKGAKTALIPVTLIDDTEGESGETVVLKLTGNAGYRVASLGTHTLTIADNEPVVSFASASQSAGEGSGTHDVGVTLSPAPTTNITFTYTVGGTATAGSDYTALSGTVTVPKGAKTALIPVTLIDDTEGESGETVVLKLTGNAGYRVASLGTHTLTIADNEPVVSFASASQSAGEGSGTHDVGVTLSPAPTTNITFTYTVGGTATAGSDYTALSGTVTVPKGATTALIPVTLIDDTESESGETVVLKLSGSTGYRVGSPGTHTVTIVDNEPVVSFASASQGVGEGSGTRNVGVRLDEAPATDLTLAYTVGGTATAGSDFTIADSGTVTVPRGATTATIPVAVIDDSAQEGSETVVLKLTGSAGYKVGSPGTHTLTIAANDEPMVSFPKWGLQELEWSGTHDVKLTLDPAQAVDITLTYKVSGTATPDEDYTALPGTLVVPAGATTAVIPVTIIDDTHEDNGESVVLTLVEGPGYKVRSDRIEHFRMFRFHILNDDVDEPAVTIAAGTSLVTEGAGAAFTLTADPAPSADLPVTVTVAADGDYGIAAGERTVTIPTSGSATLTLATTGDDADEPDGSVTVTVKDGDGYTVGAAASGSITIEDDDAPPVEPVVTLATGASPVTEGTDATFTLTATPPPAAGLPVTVTVATDGDWGVTAGSRTVTVPTTGSAVLTLPTTGDDADEPDGSVTVTVTDGDGYTVGTAASGSITIEDDDAPATLDWTDYQTVVSYLIEVRDHPENPAVKGNAAHIAKWNRVLEALGHDTGTGVAPMAASVIHANAAQWPDSPFKAASVYLKSQEQQQEPAVTIAAGTSPVTEGGDATFTLTATPPPAADLAVSVTVATDGDYGITAGPQTVTISTTGSAVLTLPTTGDSADEPDGSVTVTVKDGDGYTVGTSSSGTVAIQDDDAPPVEPAVTIAAGTSPVTEGGDATFTLTATPPPATDLAVSVTVATDGAWGISAGPRTVTVPTTGSATLTLATTDDSADEPDGSVTVTVQAGSGYTVGASASGSITIEDDDAPPGTPDWTDYQTVVSYLVEVRDNPKNTAVKGNPVHIAKWNR